MIPMQKMPAPARSPSISKILTDQNTDSKSGAAPALQPNKKPQKLKNRKRTKSKPNLPPPRSFSIPMEMSFHPKRSNASAPNPLPKRTLKTIPAPNPKQHRKQKRPKRSNRSIQVLSSFSTAARIPTSSGEIS